MKVPNINWIPFDKLNPPENLCPEQEMLILLREDNYDNGKTWRYSVDIAHPYGTYLDDFWDTCNDWLEGQRVEVIGYAELPYSLLEDDLKDAKNFNTPMGTVYFEYAPYCIGCQRFEPYARATCKTDKDGKVIWTKDHMTIKDGVSISCMHRFMCQNIAHELIRRLEGNDD